MNGSLVTRRRAAFTMIELLIAIAIIGIMASAMLASLAGLLEEGKIARTKSQIARIDMLIGERWDSYRTRTVPYAAPSLSPTQLANPRTRAGLRLNAIRELMRMEMPERITDIQDDPVSGIALPSLTRRYRQKIALNLGGTVASPSYSNWDKRYEGAECLFMILQSMTDGDGNGLDFFTPPEIGDIDSDQMREVLDAWGHPIEFLRWAPGFASDRQVIFDPANPPMTPFESYDPHDPLKADSRWTNASTRYSPCPLFPLVFSAGPDGIYAIATDDGSQSIRYSQSSPGNIQGLPYPSPLLSYPSPPNDPYRANRAGDMNGKQDNMHPDGSYVDNIHNHLLEVN